MPTTAYFTQCRDVNGTKNIPPNSSTAEENNSKMKKFNSTLNFNTTLSLRERIKCIVIDSQTTLNTFNLVSR